MPWGHKLSRIWVWKFLSKTNTWFLARYFLLQTRFNIRKTNNEHYKETCRLLFEHNLGESLKKLCCQKVNKINHDDEFGRKSYKCTSKTINIVRFWVMVEK